MPYKKNIKTKSRKRNNPKKNGLAKIATMTTKSLSNAYVNLNKKKPGIKKN